MATVDNQNSVFELLKSFRFRILVNIQVVIKDNLEQPSK